ncbi:Immunoglobulin subtype 2 domain and Immunoglobulin subtype domain and Immunoglobulin-like domain and Immunoglobulin I-set domain and Immunoglobulin V-set domain and Immunoglobulin-like fold domain-containing protein [Strongyloides ratti]|uniref:Ig-like domain-containing protein n=1 Tax=Strongyloides ratti TaxID=34506 RepID=A0A090LE91_STRRB|nr:Immunoglobulin subtype 2 domain and Immunoglobulin subtype domain and Immunoglobulin-like domain and Immunoglobulin I-set domain and Immunoglobulin V-set domain and Immunoglobulin-like fold domain-containing protein [Strongyloides ratti]CEF66463.1 Immunoglobulin subtype 2 domain and Immunoglobulin subtype domain and Immunoglobulin-like domain and Immunoglobulin I-set domain and Immunoglobulin V-set domain and Immunoglobulin-like fold domain-containing protein [Strongyloides ratti]
MRFNASESSLLMFPTLICQIFNVCIKSPTPYFYHGTMKNITSVQGSDITISCLIEDIGKHMVAFIKDEIPPRLIAFDDRIFRQREKYEIVPRVNNKEWILKIKNAQADDSGGYICQINTDPIITKTSYVTLKIPPTVSRSSTPAAVEVREGHNVTLICEAHGNPPPTIIWRRADKQLIRFNGATGYGSSVFNGSLLELIRVSRKHMSEYICLASNGVPPDESWTVKLHVTFPPIVLPQLPVVEAIIGSFVRLVCNVEAWPKGDFKWEFNGQELYENDRIIMEQTVEERYRNIYILEIRELNYGDFGIYICSVVNDYGKGSGEIQLIEAPTRLENNLITEGSAFSSEDDEDSYHNLRSIFPTKNNHNLNNLDNVKDKHFDIVKPTEIDNSVYSQVPLYKFVSYPPPTSSVSNILKSDQKRTLLDIIKELIRGPRGSSSASSFNIIPIVIVYCPFIFSFLFSQHFFN